MSVMGWIGIGVFVLAIIGLIYGGRGGGDREPYETRSVIEDAAGLGD